MSTKELVNFYEKMNKGKYWIVSFKLSLTANIILLAVTLRYNNNNDYLNSL
jgi:hypothetical protein